MFCLPCHASSTATIGSSANDLARLKSPRTLRRLKPSRFLTLPDEVLLELLSACDPLSLLRLSRTCRRLRTLLLSRSSAQTWETARANVAPIDCKRTQMLPFGVSVSADVAVGLPSPPPWMAEPGFARLIFEDSCTGCGDSGTIPLPEMLRRACQSCSAEDLVGLDDLVQSRPGMNYTFARELLRSCRTVSGTSTIRVWKSEFDAALQRWQDSDGEETATIESLAVASPVTSPSRRGHDKKFADAWRDWIKAERSTLPSQQPALQIPLEAFGRPFGM